MTDYRREAEVAREAALAGGKVVARHSRGERDSWDKAEDSPVTQADLEANEAILGVLRRAFPDDAILSEETRDSPERLDAERVWIIDPLDGTKEFVEGVPQFSVSVALAVRGKPVTGCVYQPLTRDCFWAAAGMGAFLGDEKSRVSGARRLSECKVLSSRTEMKRGQMDPYKDIFAEIEPVGSVALKLAMVSAARGDLWISAAPKSEWDVCAGDLLVREAGGRFITMECGERIYNQENVLLQPLMIAGPKALVEELRARGAAS